VGRGGSIETSSPALAIPLDRFLFVGVESTRSPSANFVDGRRARVDFDWLSDVAVVVFSGNGDGTVDAKVDETGVAGVFKSAVDARLWRPVVVRRRGRGFETVGVLMLGTDVDVLDEGVGKKTPFEPLARNW